MGRKIIFPLSSSVIPSVNSSAGISLLSDARWHYLLRGRWLQSATGLNSPRRRWDRGLDDILFFFFFFLIYGGFANVCEVAESGSDGEKNKNNLAAVSMHRLRGQKPYGRMSFLMRLVHLSSWLINTLLSRNQNDVRYLNFPKCRERLCLFVIVSSVSFMKQQQCTVNWTNLLT